MDWSLIALLFAVGFALAGLAFLISTVSKVMTKPPPSQNIPPTIPQPPPYQQSPATPAYNWSLNGARVQKLALGQGSSGGPGPPAYAGEQLSVGQPEETEPGLIPISYSIVPAQIPVFSQEPIHQAQRVHEALKPAPIPHSVAMPVDRVPEPNAVATPASYFRMTPTVQEVSGRKIRETVNRANRASSVATPINPDGEARGFFHEEEVIEVIDVEVSDGLSVQVPKEGYTPSGVFEQELAEQDSTPDSAATIQFAPEPPPSPAWEPKSEPGPVKNPVPEPVVEAESVPIPESEPISKPVSEPEPVSEPAADESPELICKEEPVSEPIPESGPAADDTLEPANELKSGSDTGTASEEPKLKPLKSPKKKRARGWKRRKQLGQVQSQKVPPVPNAPPAERVIPSKADEKTEPKKKPEAKVKSVPQERVMRVLRMFASRIAEKIPEPIRNIAGPVLFCLCVAVCLLCLSLFTYFDKHPYVPKEEPPVIVDIPPVEPESELEPKEEPGAVEKEEPRYKMAMLGEQESVSATTEGFESTFETADYTGVPFYALTFAIQLDSDPGSEFQKIQVFDASTMEDLTSTGSSILHTYTGEIPSDEYLLEHPIKSAPVVSSAVSDEIITCVFISLEKRSIHELKVILYQASGTDTHTEKEIVINAQPENIRMTSAYPMGNSLMRLGDQYYVAEPGTGIGAVPDENKYVTRKIRCVSLPLTGSVSGLDASSTALFDRQTGERRDLPAETEMYYQENHVEGEDVMEICFGIQLSGGSYEEAAAFLDDSFPGYVLDGQSIIF